MTGPHPHHITSSSSSCFLSLFIFHLDCVIDPFPSAMARSRGARLLTLAVANVLLPLAVLVFASGFFPFKPLLSGLATFRGDFLEDEPAIFGRVIFMVVDALRSDFVYGHHSAFDFTQRYAMLPDPSVLPLHRQPTNGAPV